MLAKRTLRRLPSSPVFYSVLALLVFTLFVFSSTDGDIGNWGDDTWIVTESANVHGSYWQMMCGRGFLTPFYIWVYRMAGSNVWRDHCVSYAAFILSAFAGFFLLRKLAGTMAALLGTLFYLSYPPRHEIIAWLSASAYLVVTLCFLLAVWIASRNRLPPWTKGILIALLHWIFLHLNESLLVAAPLYPALEAYRRRMRGERILTWNWLPTFFPLLVSVLHVALIYFGTQSYVPDRVPIWIRDSHSPSGAVAFFLHSLHALWLGIMTAVGSAGSTSYGWNLYVGLYSFLRWVPWSPWLVAGAGGALVAAIAAFRQWSRGCRAGTDAGNSVARRLSFAAGIYLALFAHAVGVTVIRDGVPGRLLTFNAIGFSIVFGICGAALLRRRKLAAVVLAVLLSVTFAQGAAMNALLYQYQACWRYDRSIFQQILALAPSLRPGDGIFLSWERTPLVDNFLVIQRPQFVAGSGGLLFSGHFGRGAGSRSPLYVDQYRLWSVPHLAGEQKIQWKPEFAFAVPQGTLYPFYCGGGAEPKVLAIERIEFLSIDGAPLAARRFFENTPIPPDMTTTLVSDGASMLEGKLDRSRTVCLALRDPGLSLAFDLKNERSAGPAGVELWQQDRLVASTTLAPRETRRWSVPLDNLTGEADPSLRPATAGNPAVSVMRVGLSKRN